MGRGLAKGGARSEAVWVGVRSGVVPTEVREARWGKGLGARN